jgi:hypothetical protein
MNERELGHALLNLDMSASDPREATRVVLDKDRARVTILTRQMIGAWVVAVILVLVVMVQLALLFPRHALLRDELAAGKISPTEIGKLHVAYMEDFQKTMLLAMCSIIALLLAGFFSAWLLAASRQATLRQVNANLIEIGQELKALRQSPGK